MAFVMCKAIDLHVDAKRTPMAMPEEMLLGSVPSPTLLHSDFFRVEPLLAEGIFLHLD